MRKAMIIILAALMIGGAYAAEVDTSIVNTDRSASFAVAAASGAAAIARAASLGHAWTTSDQLMAQAKDAFDAGDESKAIDLADEARIHADLASLQAEREAEAWQDNVIRSQ